ncbi:MAG: methyltransferase domain-containing protein [Nitrospiraceae bacterium]
MTVQTELYDRIRRFWDQQPCSTTHVSLPQGTMEYFLALDRYFSTIYPYLSPFLDAKAMGAKRVMEVGLGSGYTLQRIAEHAGETYALDLSLETLKLNKARATHFSLNIKFIHASATELPLPDKSMDLVVSIGCLHHIPDIQRAVDEIYRVLRPGGVLKGMVYNRNSYRYRVSIPLARRWSSRWSGKSSDQCVSEMYDGDDNPYGTVYSKHQMSQILRRFGRVNFEVQNFSGHDVIPKIGNLVPRQFWISTLGKIVGLDLYFTATKF